MANIIKDSKGFATAKLLTVRIVEKTIDKDILYDYESLSKGIKKGDVRVKAGTKELRAEAVFMTAVSRVVKGKKKGDVKDKKVSLSLSYGTKENPSNRYYLEKALGLEVPEFEESSGDELDAMSLLDGNLDAESLLENVSIDNYVEKEDESEYENELKEMVETLDEYANTVFKFKTERDTFKDKGKKVEYDKWLLNTLQVHKK